MLDRLTRLQLTIFAVVTVLAVGAISVFYLHVPAARRHRLLQRQREFRCRRRALPERQRHLPRRDDRAGRVGRADQRRRRRRHAAQHRHAGARQRHRHGQERVGRRRAVHRPGAAGGRRRTRCCATGRPSAWTTPPIGQDIAGLLTQADKLVSSIGNSRIAGSAARNVQGVQRIRARTGAADPVVAAAGRRGQRQLRADHPADRPGRARSSTRRSAAATTSSRWPTGWPASPARWPTPIRSCGRCCRPCPAPTRGGQHHVRRHPADVPDAGRQPGQLRPHRRDLPQVDRAGAGDLPGADGRADHRRRRRARRRGRQAGLQGRPRRSAAVLDGLHPADRDPVARRHHAARPADRPVLQDGAERSGRGARRAQLSVPGVPRQAGTDRSAVPRPARVRADRHQPVARAADPVRTPMPVETITTSRGEHPAAQQVPVHPAGGGLRSRARRRCSCRPVCCPDRGPRRNAPFPLPVPPNDNGRRRRRGRTTRRRIRSCRRTAGPRRSARSARPGPLPAEAPAPDAPAPDAPPPPADGAPPQASGAATTTYDSRTGVFVDPAGGTGVFAGGTDKLAPAENVGRSDDGSTAGVMGQNDRRRHDSERRTRPRPSRRGRCRPAAPRSRAAGPASGVAAAPVGVTVEAPAAGKVRVARPVGPPPRRQTEPPARRDRRRRPSPRSLAIALAIGVAGCVRSTSSARPTPSRPASSGSSTRRRRPWSTCSATTRTPSTRA